jgi:hypothetical protein
VDDGLQAASAPQVSPNPHPLHFAMLTQLQKTLNLPAPFRIAATQIEDETGGCHSNTERK